MTPAAPAARAMEAAAAMLAAVLEKMFTVLRG